MVKTMKYRKRVTVLVHNKGKFLVCKPNHQDNYWTLPGGGIDGQETPEEAGLRECLEEAGHRPKWLRLLKLEHTIGREHFKWNIGNYAGMHTFYVLGEYGTEDRTLWNTEGDGCETTWLSFTEAKRVFNKTLFDSQNLEALEFALQNLR